MSVNSRANKKHLRLVDIIIVILCLSITVCSVNLFRNDLYQTIRLQNVQPVGTITIKNHIVQRRIADRVLWDRLRVTSPVYLGDVIRVAELSEATLNIEDQQLDIGENTLIRIQLSPDGSGALQIELTEGNLVYSNSGVADGLRLNLMNRLIETEAGTTFAASAGKDGIALRVIEGRATLIEDGTSREIAPGTMIALNGEGIEQRAPAAVVTQPRPNARYVKSAPEPIPVRFAWNRVNLRPQDTLRLEIAADRNFSRGVQSLENLNSAAEVLLEAGTWNWRLLYENTVLSGGRINVVEALDINLLSPARGSVIRYRDGQPSLRIQWPQIEEAAHYVIEIAPTPDFANPQITKQIDAPFFVDSSLTEGTWYWRVKPVFSSAYEGSAPFSNTSFFRIEQTDHIAAGEQTATMLEGEQLRELERSVGNEPPPEPAAALVATPPPAPPAPRPAATPPAPAPQPPRQTAVTVRTEPPPRTETPPPAPAPVTPPVTEAPPAVSDTTAPPIAATPSRAETPPEAATPSREESPFPPPRNMRPADRYIIGIEELKTRRNIVFRWSAVPGANAYIFVLYEQSANGRREINRVTVPNPAWTLENTNVLERGSFVWQVEAVNRNADGAVIRRGTTAENTFTMDIPAPLPVQIDDPGILYGF
jgi:hypothetical protein